ncbi:MAG TPA: hypothetical protein ENF60_00855 [Candidatus Omnitrophica bacterium]|nr:hypothetical protein [Candidatus Omnitrophota bacterium]
MIIKFIKNFKIHEIYRQATILFLAITIGNVFNMLYHIIMVRKLSPEEYGILNTLFACILFFALPITNIQIALTRFIARYHGLQSKLAIEKILKGIFIRIFILALIIGIVIILFASRIEIFLKLHDIKPVLYMAGVVSASLIMPLSLAGLEGLQKFISMGLVFICTHFSKLVLAIIFIYLGWGVNGALNSITISNLLGIIIGYPALSRSLKELNYKNENILEVNFRDLYLYILPVSLATLTFTVLTNLDVILVKHFFSPLEAGYYSIAQVIGRIILFLPMGISMVMFPKVVYSQAREENTIEHFKHSIIYTIALIVGGSVFVFLFPTWILKIFTGRLYPQCLPLIRRFAVSMGLFSLNFSFLVYYLSINKWKYILPFLIFSLVEIIVISLWHLTLTAVVDIVILVAFVLLLFNITLLRIHHK